MTVATADSAPRPPFSKDLVKLALGAVGIVYGDIGTSPLYALKECFQGEHAVAVNAPNVLGITSLVFWGLMLVVSIKYLVFVLNADHEGEGGILALLALASRRTQALRASAPHVLIVMLGLAGAALLYGDGIITPAISVLSAVEGLEVATPVFQPYIVPITVVILIGLFLVQKRGTSGIGSVFGPLMVIWFVCIAAVALPWVVREPAILSALNPAHALRFLGTHGTHGILVLGAVVLCITGAEALYADLGHFGTGPIRLAWSLVVLPSLLLNYFGQGALLLIRGPQAAANPFYQMVPETLLYPMVVLATIATVIASQALISGAYSLTNQAVQLGYLPRMLIVHTSNRKEGQIYVPRINSLLMVACVLLVLSFKQSTNLAAAYGIAVTGTMVITSLLFFLAMKDRWGRLRAGALTVLFLIVDLAFFAGNVGKIPHGGWLTILAAAVVFTVMTTWRKGRMLLRQSVMSATLPIQLFLEDLRQHGAIRVRGAAVFMTLNPDIAPAALLHNFKHCKMLHDQVVLLTVQTERVPEVPDSDRLVVKELGQGFYQAIAKYGYMQRPNVPDLMARCRSTGIELDPTPSFYLSREQLIATGRSGMHPLRTGLFAFLTRNAHSATDYFGIPPNAVVELGMVVEL